MGWQWHQLDHTQIIWPSLQTDNHASTSPLSFYRPDAFPAVQSTVSKHWGDTKFINILHQSCSNIKRQPANPDLHSFSIFKFYWLVGWWSRCISTPNFVQIGQSIAKISWFFLFFKTAAIRHLGFDWCVFAPPTKKCFLVFITVYKIWLLSIY